MTFRKYVNENTTIKKIEDAFGEKLLPFLDELQLYIDYNDDREHKTTKFISSHKKELKKAGFLTNPTKVYRLVKLEKKEVGKKPTKKPAYSASTEKLTGGLLDSMKNMITTFKQKGDFYYIVIDDCEGLDINSFGKVFIDNKDLLLNKYNQSNIMPFFLETMEEKSGQKEFLIFGQYGTDKIEEA